MKGQRGLSQELQGKTQDCGFFLWVTGKSAFAGSGPTPAVGDLSGVPRLDAGSKTAEISSLAVHEASDKIYWKGVEILIRKAKQ